jgi:hypothetical protein
MEDVMLSKRFMAGTCGYNLIVQYLVDFMFLNVLY